MNIPSERAGADVAFGFVVRVMTSRGRRWITTALAVAFVIEVALILATASAASILSLRTALFAASALGLTAVSVSSWTRPVVTFSGEGARFSSKRLIPWNAIDSVDVGASPPWPRAPRIVMRDGDRISLYGVDRAALARVESILPDGVRLRAA